MDDAAILGNVLRRFGGELGPGSPKLKAWFRTNQISAEALRSLAGCFLRRSIYVGAIELYSEKGSMYVNGDDGIPLGLKVGLLVVGSCPNGDPVVIHVRDRLGQAGYVNHESMWREPDIRTVFVPLAPSLGLLAVELANETAPLNYFDAQKIRRCAA